MPIEASDPTRRHRYLFAALLLLVTSLWSVCLAQSTPAERFEFIEAPLEEEEEFGLAAAAEQGLLPSQGNLHALVVFAQFADEAPAAIPEFAARLFDPDYRGSFTHFYTTMSFGQLRIQGTVLPKRYVSDHPKTIYLSKKPKKRGRYGQFALEILQKVDRDIDLRLLDNDGPDSMPNSGDDDGTVDFVFMILKSVPPDFLLGEANGIAGLRLDPDPRFEARYRSADTTTAGNSIYISGADARGVILEEGTFTQTMGVMAHEFGHSLGLPDLYDLSFQSTPDQHPSKDGAGVGAWCLMGRGALGWNEKDDGPNPLCAWSREQLGWIGRDNERLVEIQKDTTELEIASLYQQGFVYKIPLEPEVIQPGVLSQSYLLVEQRVRSAHHYDRHLPGEGLLIWRVRSRFRDNSQEEQKLVDLVCADGLYQDVGFPLGRVPAPDGGGDNLDFWARDEDESYRRVHEGNLGDATDLFDGVRFTQLAPNSNPSTIGWGQQSEAYSGLVINHLHPRGNAIIADISLPRWAGTIREQVYWAGEVLVDGDLTIAPGGVLILYSNSHICFAGSDRFQAGRDPALCELNIQGDLRGMPPPVKFNVGGGHREVETVPTVFEALVPGQRWWGILPAGIGRIQLLEDNLVLRDAEYGLLQPGFEPGKDVPTAVSEESNEEPAVFALLPNYPNPFDQETTLRYTLATPSQVQLTIYNALGQTVRTLVDDYQSKGLQQVVWDGRDEHRQDAASGVYLYRLEVPGKYAANSKMLLLRSGFSWISPLDTILQARGADWSALRRELVVPLEPAFGVAAKPSTTKAAFTVGAAWLSLSVPGQAPQETRSQVELLRALLLQFAPSPAQLQAIDTLSVYLKTGSLSPELFDQGHRAVIQLLQTHSSQAATYFCLGEWLQRLRTAGLVARHLTLPLSAVVDLSSSAAISRQFSTDLGNLQADERTVSALDRLAALLAADPRSEEELRAVLELLEEIADPLTIR